MKKVVHFIFTMISLLICSELISNDIDLEKAFNNDSQEELIKLLDRWASSSKPLSKDAFNKMFKFEKEAYKIFEDFYTPLSLDRINFGNERKHESLYKNCNYILIQSGLAVSFVDTIHTDTMLGYLKCHINRKELYSHLTINNFRPKVSIEGKKTIYLRYGADIKAFLNKEHKFNKYEQKRACDRSEIKQEFLNRQIKVFRGHWDYKVWHIASYPTINKIIFNKDMTQALIYFSYLYSGGEAYYCKEQGEWKIINAVMTWMT